MQVMAEFYRIVIRGHLDARWSIWFSGLEMTPSDGGRTLLAGYLLDQAALHGVLDVVQQLGLTLISLNSGCPEGSSGLSGREGI